MQIEYIYDTKSEGFEGSIARVFKSVIKGIRSQFDAKVEQSYVKPIGYWLISMFINGLRYGFKSYLHTNKIYHITGCVHYLACFMNPRNTILTIHDLVILNDASVNKYYRSFIYWLWYYIPIKRLKYVTCISEATKNDIINRFPWAASKLTVISDPIDDMYRYIPNEYNNVLPTILHVGTRSNKNLERVIEALNGIKCHLRIIKPLEAHQIRLLEKYQINYTNAYNLTDEEMVEEYCKADIISFPSLFEGFGMPIIEGQTVGRPIVTSDREPMKSVAGNGALLVNPESVDSIRTGFLSVMNNDALRQLLIKKGLDNARRFNYLVIAEKYYKYYQKNHIGDINN